MLFIAMCNGTISMGENFLAMNVKFLLTDKN